MSCYFRHMQDLFEELNVVVTKENKKAIDRVLHEAAGVEYKNCSAAWKAVKEETRGDAKTRALFLAKVREHLPGV